MLAASVTVLTGAVGAVSAMPAAFLALRRTEYAATQSDRSAVLLHACAIALILAVIVGTAASGGVSGNVGNAFWFALITGAFAGYVVTDYRIRR